MTLQMFTCPNISGNLRLTTNSCSAQWGKAAEKKPEKGDFLFECRGCEIGAINSGVIDTSNLRKPGEIDRMCCRCHRGAKNFVYKRLCISCYNRGLEVIKGVNAKGSKPVKHGPVFSVKVAYLLKGRRVEQVIDRVSSVLEAELAVIRECGTRISFVRSAARMMSNQNSLFGQL